MDLIVTSPALSKSGGYGCTNYAWQIVDIWVLESQAVTTTEGAVGICTLAAALGEAREALSKSKVITFTSPADSNC